MEIVHTDQSRVQHRVSSYDGLDQRSVPHQLEGRAQRACDPCPLDLHDVLVRQTSSHRRHSRSADATAIRRANHRDVKCTLALSRPSGAVEIGHPEQVGGSPAGDRGIRRKRNSDRMRAERRIRCFRVTAPEPDAAGGNMPQRSSQLARRYAGVESVAQTNRTTDEVIGHGRKHARQRGSPGRLCAQPHPQEPPFGSITHDARAGRRRTNQTIKGRD